MVSSSELKYVWLQGASIAWGIAPLALAMVAGLVVPTAPNRETRSYPVSRVLQWVDYAFVAKLGAAGPYGTELFNGALHGWFVGGVLWLWCPTWVCAVAAMAVTLFWGIGHGYHRISQRRLNILAVAKA